MSEQARGSPLKADQLKAKSFFYVTNWKKADRIA